MAVQKTNILTFIDEKLNRKGVDDIADILDEINIVLKDLSKRAKWPDLYRSNVEADRSSISEGNSAISFPTGFRVLDKIVINDGTNDGRPLTEITFEKWLRYREDESSSGYNEPKRFARRGKKWYPDPIPNTDYTAKYWFWRHHPVTTGDTEDILFGDEFDIALKYGVTAEVARTYGRERYIAIWEPRFEIEVNKLRPLADRDITLAKYSDI